MIPKRDINSGVISGLWNCIRLMGPIPCRSVYQNRKAYIRAVTFIRVVTHFRAETHIYQGRVDVTTGVIKKMKKKDKTMGSVTDRHELAYISILGLFLRLLHAPDLWAADGTVGERHSLPVRRRWRQAAALFVGEG